MYSNICILILAGIILALALDDLSRNQNTTQYLSMSGYMHHYYQAGYAVDGNIFTCTRTDAIGGNSPYTSTWWKVDLGGVYNIYSVNIVFKNYDNTGSKQRGRFAGFSLYVSTTGDRVNSSLCYKDGPELPPLNFTTTCITSGRYMIYYNERLKGVKYPDGYQLDNVYTELCEVTVWECPGGWYGVDCKQQCSGHCKDNYVCNHVTGQCDRGCAAGWTGALCDTGCADGTYCNDCIHNCSRYCLSDSPCNKTNGHCEGGCKPGYSQPLCNEPCSGGHFGNKCEKVCSEHCLNDKNICDSVDGTCTGGCKDGYTGNHCNESCTVGYYGQNCSRVCSSNCKSCKHTDGTCSCPAGLTGSNCSIDKRADPPSLLSNVTPVAVGATLSACVILIIVGALFVIRRKRISRSCTKSSPYADLELRPSGESTYQQLNVTGLDNTYQNQPL